MQKSKSETEFTPYTKISRELKANVTNKKVKVLEENIRLHILAQKRTLGIRAQNTGRQNFYIRTTNKKDKNVYGVKTPQPNGKLGEILVIYVIK